MDWSHGVTNVTLQLDAIMQTCKLFYNDQEVHLLFYKVRQFSSMMVHFIITHQLIRLYTHYVYCSSINSDSAEVVIASPMSRQSLPHDGKQSGT